MKKRHLRPSIQNALCVMWIVSAIYMTCPAGTLEEQMHIFAIALICVIALSAILIKWGDWRIEE